MPRRPVTLDLANTRGIRALCRLEDTVEEHQGHRMVEVTVSQDTVRVQGMERILTATVVLRRPREVVVATVA